MNLLNLPFQHGDSPEYKKTTLDYFIFLLFFFYGSGLTAFSNNDISLVIMSGLGFLYMHFSRQEKVDNIFWYILIYWILINFLSWVFIGSRNFSFFTLGGSVFKLFIGYVFMKIYKENSSSGSNRLFFPGTCVLIIFYSSTPEFGSIFKNPFQFRRSTTRSGRALVWFYFSLFQLASHAEFGICR